MDAISIVPTPMEAMCAVAMLDIKFLPTTGLVWVRKYTICDTQILKVCSTYITLRIIICYWCTTSHHTDRDECALGISGCNQYCTNTNGSYFCSCYLGYQISSNSRMCVGKRTVHDTKILHVHVVSYAQLPTTQT